MLDGQKLGPYLGYTLNQAGISAIELLQPSRRYRCIDVADLVAFARCLDRSVLWFLSEVDDLVLGTAIDNASDTQLLDEVHRRLAVRRMATRKASRNPAVTELQVT